MTVDDILNTVNVLNSVAKSVEINGTIHVWGLATGGKSTQSDRLDCGKADVKLQANSFIDVEITGNNALGLGNQWTLMAYGSIAGNWGQQPAVPAGMTPSTGANAFVVSN